MFYGKSELLLRLILTGSIGICSAFGDKVLEHDKGIIIRAVFDNLTHAVVGGLTWTLILVLSKKSVIQNLPSIFLCIFLSSFIDLDHFIAARSWKISDATQLNKRPFLHCTTIPIVTSLILLLNSLVFNYPRLYYLSWIILASFLSHHIRDATRRGLWFCPIGSTPPIPYYLYITLSMVLPYILHWFMTLYIYPIKTHDHKYRETTHIV